MQNCLNKLSTSINFYNITKRSLKNSGMTKKLSGAKRIWTADPLHAMQVLYQLSYGPKFQNVSDINLS